MSDKSFILTVVCAECNKTFPHHNPNNIIEKDEICFSVEFNFKDGSLNFVCPECKKMNKLEFISHDNIMRYNRLPSMRISRG